MNVYSLFRLGTNAVDPLHGVLNLFSTPRDEPFIEDAQNVDAHVVGRNGRRRTRQMNRRPRIGYGNSRSGNGRDRRGKYSKGISPALDYLQELYLPYRHMHFDDDR